FCYVRRRCRVPSSGSSNGSGDQNARQPQASGAWLRLPCCLLGFSLRTPHTATPFQVGHPAVCVGVRVGLIASRARALYHTPFGSTTRIVPRVRAPRTVSI